MTGRKDPMISMYIFSDYPSNTKLTLEIEVEICSQRFHFEKVHSSIYKVPDYNMQQALKSITLRTLQRRTPKSSLPLLQVLLWNAICCIGKVWWECIKRAEKDTDLENKNHFPWERKNLKRNLKENKFQEKEKTKILEPDCVCWTRMIWHGIADIGGGQTMLCIQATLRKM